MKKEKFISRINNETGGGCYWVRFMEGTNDPVMGLWQKHKAQKSFTDLRCGGKANALSEAIKWRDMMMEKLCIRHDRVGIPVKVPRSDTGIVGVTVQREIKTLVGGGESLFFSYRASWRQLINGKRTNRGKQFGYDPNDPESKEKAFKKAKAVRKKMQKLHYII